MFGEEDGAFYQPHIDTMPVMPRPVALPGQKPADLKLPKPMGLSVGMGNSSPSGALSPGSTSNTDTRRSGSNSGSSSLDGALQGAFNSFAGGAGGSGGDYGIDLGSFSDGAGLASNVGGALAGLFGGGGGGVSGDLGELPNLAGEFGDYGTLLSDSGGVLADTGMEAGDGAFGSGAAGADSLGGLYSAGAGYLGGLAGNAAFGGGTGSQIGGAIGGIAGSYFGPLGSAAGSFIGSGIGSAFGGHPSVGPGQAGLSYYGAGTGAIHPQADYADADNGGNPDLAKAAVGAGRASLDNALNSGQFTVAKPFSLHVGSNARDGTMWTVQGNDGGNYDLGGSVTTQQVLQALVDHGYISGGGFSVSPPPAPDAAYSTPGGITGVDYGGDNWNGGA